MANVKPILAGLCTSALTSPQNYDRAQREEQIEPVHFTAMANITSVLNQLCSSLFALKVKEIDSRCNLRKHPPLASCRLFRHRKNLV